MPIRTVTLLSRSRTSLLTKAGLMHRFRLILEDMVWALPESPLEIVVNESRDDAEHREFTVR